MSKGINDITICVHVRIIATTLGQMMGFMRRLANFTAVEDMVKQLKYI